MDNELHPQVIAAAKRLRRTPQVLAFSCGADSVASLVRMQQWGMKPELLYLYFIPDLPMVESYLRYVEDKIGQRVHRLPSKLAMEYLVNGVLQKPGIGEWIYKHCAKSDIGIPDSTDINEYFLECFPENTHVAVGLRVSDGIFRARKLKEQGVIHPGRPEWYPVADCFQSDIVRIIENAGWKLPVDYRLFGRSFESIRHWSAPPIRERCPRTWKRICEVFPMAPLLCAQEAMLPKSHSIKARITAFSHLAFTTEDCNG